MAKKEKLPNALVMTDASAGEVEDFTIALIRDLNKEMGQRVAYNLSENTAPTIVKRWVPTGSIQLDYAIRNASGGGYPEGRIIEVSGLPSNGKSHLAYHAAANVQAMGGLVIYIDTENATPVDKLALMGINIRSRFVYCDTHCTEEVFKIIESTILKAKQVATKNIPILVIWDSVAATSPLAELNGEYEDNTMGLQARTISKCMRKVTGVIGQNNVTLMCLNQLREKIGVMHGDPLTTPGGRAIPFHASLRIRLSSGTQVKDKNGAVIGIHVIVTITKNKVAPPFRKYEFDIIFGKGIVEHEYIFDELRSHVEKHGIIKREGKDINIEGTGSWKLLRVSDSATGEVIVEKKFYKAEFGDVMKDPKTAPWVTKAIDAVYSIEFGDHQASEGESPTNDEGDEFSDG